MPMSLIRSLTVMLILIATGAFTKLAAAQNVEEGAKILYSSKSKALQLKRFRELTVDHLGAREGEVYGPKGLYQMLDRLGFTYIPLSNVAKDATDDYPTPEEIGRKLQALHSRYAHLSELFSIGKSGDGRDLWVMKLSNRPKEDLPRPEFKYISSMHGDEITGRELTVQLIEDLLSGYGRDQRITRLLDTTEIFIMPSMNPDGSQRRQRGNAKNIDLNRSFPDFTTNDRSNTSQGRPVETQAVMKWESTRHFALSANFHGGAEVVNYPWDTSQTRHPLDGLVQQLSLEYSSRVPYLRNSREFSRGITNGFDWYEVDGGMQDWSYNWHDDLQVTVELSDAKWPEYSEIPGFYKSNREALIRYIELTHQGGGFVLPDAGKRGTVVVHEGAGNGREIVQGSFNNSEYWRILPPGKYTFEVKVTGESGSRLLDVTVPNLISVR